MTVASFSLTGRSFEARMQSMLRQREAWLVDHPGVTLRLVVNRDQKNTVGFWLDGHGIAYEVMAHHGPSPDEVWGLHGEGETNVA